MTTAPPRSTARRPSTRPPDRAIPTTPSDGRCPPDARDVLDLAAGTGKLTERLVALGWHVVAVEPSDAMRAELTAVLPAVEAFPGTAERTGLPDASVDAVTIAQAWHWVDPPAASAEIARILRPGGQVAAIWNVRDQETDWVARWTEIVHRGDTPGDQLPRPGARRRVHRAGARHLPLGAAAARRRPAHPRREPQPPDPAAARRAGRAARRDRPARRHPPRPARTGVDRRAVPDGVLPGAAALSLTGRARRGAGRTTRS